MIIQKSNEIQVTDITLASALLTCGYMTNKAPIWIKSSKGDTVVFTFERSKEIERDIEAYNNKANDNELFAYFGAIQNVKNQLIADIKAKAEKFVVVEKGDSIALISEKLDTNKRKKLLERMV